MYLSDSSHEPFYCPATLTLGVVHWHLLKAANRLQERGYTFVETNPPFGKPVRTDLGNEVGKDEINWWLTQEGNPTRRIEDQVHCSS